MTDSGPRAVPPRVGPAMLESLFILNDHRILTKPELGRMVDERRGGHYGYDAVQRAYLAGLIEVTGRGSTGVLVRVSGHGRAVLTMSGQHRQSR